MNSVSNTTKVKTASDATAEAKIKAAARKVFMAKGYAGARTRDIADEAGMNLALLNYYFHNKEKLFELIMLETLEGFMKGVHEILSDENSSLRDKTQKVATSYVDLLLKNPDLPIFIMSEIRTNAPRLAKRLNTKGFFLKSPFFKQLKAAGAPKGINPVHYFMNIMGLIVFPFIARPLLENVAGLKKGEFDKLMNERKRLVAPWVAAMVQAS